MLYSTVTTLAAVPLRLQHRALAPAALPACLAVRRPLLGEGGHTVAAASASAHGFLPVMRAGTKSALRNLLLPAPHCSLPPPLRPALTLPLLQLLRPPAACVLKRWRLLRPQAAATPTAALQPAAARRPAGHCGWTERCWWSLTPSSL